VLPKRTVQRIIEQSVKDMLDSYTFAVQSAEWRADGTVEIGYIQKGL
jgi:hypothetical protein